MSDVLAIGDWRNNAEMISDVARLGYLDGAVLDLTVGEGKFWTIFRPDLVTNDLDPAKPADCHYDARRTPWGSGTFDSVVFDPPYKLQGTPASGGMDELYGTVAYVSRDKVRELLQDGTREACRLARSFVLVKCMDQVNAGKVRWQTDEATEAAAAAGFRKVDSFMLRRWRPQPAGRSQSHARRNYSTLLIFARDHK